jgi:hypothetical protein
MPATVRPYPDPPPQAGQGDSPARRNDTLHPALRHMRRPARAGTVALSPLPKTAMPRPTPTLLFLAGLAALGAATWAGAADTGATDAAARLKAAMGGPALDAITRFDYRLTVRDAAGAPLRDGRYALIPAAQALQLDELPGGARLWSDPALTWRLRDGQWETLGPAAATPYRQHVATHFLPLLRDPRTGVEERGPQLLRLTPAQAPAFDVLLEPGSGRIRENRFDAGIVATESDYREVAGIWWPMAFDVSERGTTTRQGRFSDVVAHTATDATLPPMPVTQAPPVLPGAHADAARLVGAGWLSGVDNDYNVGTDAAQKLLVFARSQPDFKDAHIWLARRDGKTWTRPQQVPFTDPRYSDSDPWLTPDGRTLYFISNRPLQGEAPRKDLELWRVAVHADGFGAPEHLAMLGSEGQELGPELHRGWLYFNSTRAGGPARMSIWRARAIGAGFGQPEALPAPFNEGAVQGDFTLSPDGNTAVFWSQRGEVKDPDLFAARRTPRGWSAAVRLPAPVNAPGMDFTPAFSPNGQRLHLASMRKPAWFDDAGHVFNGQANAWVVPARLVAGALDQALAAPAP